MNNENFFDIYLGQQEHFISIEEMEKILKVINEINNSYSQKIFGKQNISNFNIYPCEEGSFKIKIGIIGIIIWGSVEYFNNDLVKSFVEGLTGNKPEYYAKRSGEIVRDLIKGILEKPIDELEILNNQIERQNGGYILDKSIKEKSDLFLLMQKSKTIKSVSFDENNKNPIPKTDFYKHIKAGDVIRAESPIYEIRDLIIFKSINTEDRGKWFFKISDSKKQLQAEIIDSRFLSDFLNGKYPLREGDQDDVIKVLLKTETIIKNGSKEKEEYCIEKIYRFNDIEIEKIPEDCEKFLIQKNDPTTLLNWMEKRE